MSGRILIVDDVATNRIVLKVKLANARYEVLQAASAAEALSLARSQLPHLILLDVKLPNSDGVEVLRALRADPQTALIPVVMVTAFQDPETRLEALRAGADDFITKPFDELMLLARLRALLRARETVEELRLREATIRDLGLADADLEPEQPFSVALIAALPEQAILWKSALIPLLPAAKIAVLTRDEALMEASTLNAPDAYIIACDLARAGDGLRLMSELRSRPNTRYATICIALPETLRETAAVALDLGASDLLPIDMSAPYAAEECAIRLRAQILRKRTLDRQRASVVDGLRLATIDPLTGIFNRRYALPHLRRITERAAQTGRQFAVMVIDVDRFKGVNDTYGHAAGDEVLIDIASRLTMNMREVDMIARIGGEEFLAVMPEITLELARMVAERVCKVISERPVRLRDGTEIAVTVSIGLAMGRGGEDVSIVDDADQALLYSKAEGRNQVTISKDINAA